MTRLEFGIVCLVICCFLKIEAAVEVFNIKHIPSQNQSIGLPIQLDYDAFDKDRLVYFAIHRETPREKNITVYLSEKPFTNALYSCNVTVKGDYNTTDIPEVKLNPLGRDRGLIWWLEKTPQCEFEPEKCPETIIPKNTKYVRYMKFVSIHFPTCKAAETKFQHVSSSNAFSVRYSILPNETYYNLFFMSEKHCPERRCRMIIDYNGEIISEPKSSITDNKNNWLEEVRPLDGLSLESGYVTLETHGLRSVLEFTDSHGLEKFFVSNVHRPQFSIANETVAICDFDRWWSNDGYELRCKQYDLDGNLKWEWSSRRERPYQGINFLALLNLDDAVLVFSQVFKRSCEFCDMRELDYSVKKIDATGKNAGEFHLKDLGDPSRFVLLASVWKNQYTDGYCAAYANPVSQKVTTGSTIIFGNCFTDADFS